MVSTKHCCIISACAEVKMYFSSNSCYGVTAVASFQPAKWKMLEKCHVKICHARMMNIGFLNYCKNKDIKDLKQYPNDDFSNSRNGDPNNMLASLHWSQWICLGLDQPSVLTDVPITVVFTGALLYGERALKNAITLNFLLPLTHLHNSSSSINHSLV